MPLFDKNEIDSLLKISHIGLWRIEIEEGQLPRFYGDEETDYLLGIEGNISPEDRYIFHRKYIHPDDLKIFNQYSYNLTNGQAEVVYRYLSPLKGEMYVRCNGAIDLSITSYRCYKGTHQDISNSIRFENDKVAEYRLTQQLNIIKSLSFMFTSVYYIDLKADTFIELNSVHHPVHKLVGKAGNVKETMSLLLDKIVMPEYVDDMRLFADFSTANERLKNKNWIGYQFESKYRRWLEATIIAADRDEYGNCDHIIWAMHDIEDIKQKEIAQQKALIKATKIAEAANQAKTKFLFNMSHDIRTPMNAIIGFTNILKTSFSDKEKSMSCLKKISSSSDMLLSLLNEVLEMSRIESGKTNVTETLFYIDDFIHGIMNVFENQMREKNINFSINMDVIHKHIIADEAKLKEIFINLLSNAYKYTPSGGKISFSLNELPCDKENMVLYQTIIQDTGFGMSKEYLPHMFEEFSREYSVTECKIEGTGLGLPIVQKLVELMDGTISAKSELGKGTEFIIEFYHQIPIEETVTNTITNEPIQKFKGKRVLMAEDNELNAEIATMILEDAGFTVDVAADGLICLEKLAEVTSNYYDIVLMDIQMPNMDGYSASREIRNLKDKEKANIPIIAVTANAFAEDKAKAFAVGMNEHVAKPIDINDFINKISLILGI